MTQQGEKMKTIQRALWVTSVAWLLSACGATVNSTVASDTSAPAVNLLVKRLPATDLQAGNRSTPAVNLTDNRGAFRNSKWEFNVLATATDPESGIKRVKINMTRTVCYISSGGTIAKAYYGTVIRKEATYTDPRNAPTQASLGDTGRFDTSLYAIDHPVDDNLFVWINANQTRAVGVGVWTKWDMEATNFAGKVTYSDTITMMAGDLSCNPP